MARIFVGGKKTSAQKPDKSTCTSVINQFFAHKTFTLDDFGRSYDERLARTFLVGPYSLPKSSESLSEGFVCKKLVYNRSRLIWFSH